MTNEHSDNWWLRPSEVEETTPGRNAHPYSALIADRLTNPPKIEDGESIFDPNVLSRYFDDPATPERDKELLANALSPMRMSAIYNDAIRQAVGEPVRHRNLLMRGLGMGTDIAGNVLLKPLTTVLGAMDIPSRYAEQSFGFVLTLGNSDLSLSERWQLGKLTYEAYSQTGWWKFHGDDKLLEWAAQIDAGEKSIEQIIDENEGGTADLVGKIVLDPLWLAGGIPGIPAKLYKLEDAGVTVYKAGYLAGGFRRLSEGVKVADLPVIGRKATRLTGMLERTPLKPVVKGARFFFGAAVPSREAIFKEALARQVDELSRPLDEALGHWRGQKPLWRSTPQSRATELYDQFALHIAMNRPDAEGLKALQRAISTGDPTGLEQYFGSFFRTERGRVVLAALKEEGFDITKLPVLTSKRLVPDGMTWENVQDLWKAANGDATLPETSQALDNWMNLFGNYKRQPKRDDFMLGSHEFAIRLGHDLHQNAYPTLQRWAGVEGIEKEIVRDGVKTKTWVAQGNFLDRVTSGIKFTLAMTLLNTPRFVVLNVLNNMATIMYDHGLTTGLKYGRNPFDVNSLSRFGRETMELMLEDWGENPMELIKAYIGDRSVARELMFQQEDEVKWFGAKRSTVLAPMVSLAARADMGARITAFVTQYGRMRNAVWQFRSAGYGVIEDLPPDLQAKLGADMVARIRGMVVAAGPNEKALQEVFNEIRNGQPRLTGEYFWEKFADEIGLSAEQRQLWKDDLGADFFSTLEDDLRGTPEEIAKKLDDREGLMRDREHYLRRQSEMTPRPRDYATDQIAFADHVALMFERHDQQLSYMRRFLQATGVKGQRFDRAMSAIKEYHDNSLNAFRALRTEIQHGDAGMDAVIRYLYDQRAAIADLMSRQNPALKWMPGASQKMIDQFLGVESDYLTQLFYLAEDMGDTVDWPGFFKAVDGIANRTLERQTHVFGFQHRPPPRGIGGADPNFIDAHGLTTSRQKNFIANLRQRLLTESPTAQGSEAMKDLKAYFESTIRNSRDAKGVIANYARRMTDFTMLNYDERLGIDRWISTVFPYAYWPSRTMWHWGQRAMRRPGAALSTVVLYDLINENNESLPERFRHSIRIPVPFLDDQMQHGGMYIDPIKVLFPLANWSDDVQFDNEAPTNIFGQMHDYANNFGIGVNPAIDTALQYLGGDDRALYIKNRLASLPVLPAGPKQLQALHMLFTAGEDPDNVIPQEDEEMFALGAAMPENKLKQYLGLSEDEFDIYRRQRVLANMVGVFMKEPGHSEEERQQLVRDALDAMYTRKGPLWARAKRVAASENGLSVLSGWLLGMPVRQYPNGEDTQRGIDELYRETQRRSREEGGGDVTQAFHTMFPEMNVREASFAILNGGQELSTQEIAQKLYAIDLDGIHKEYDDAIKQKNMALEYIARSGRLQTEEGRLQYDLIEEERNSLMGERSNAIEYLDRRYKDRKLGESLTRTPRSRALQELERQYYDIELPEHPVSGDFEQQRSRQEELLDAMPDYRGYSPVTSAIEHYLTQRRYGNLIDEAFKDGDRDKAKKLQAERDDELRRQGEAVKGRISRDEFEAYLDRNKRMPTPEEAERDAASDQISQYFAIKEQAKKQGYTSKQVYEIGNAYWAQFPLLEKYYGDQSGYNVGIDTVGDLVRFDRMEQIWEKFHSLEGGSQARIDYLAMTIDELNDLRAWFGLPAVSLNDPYWEHDATPARYEGSLPQGY